MRELVKEMSSATTFAQQAARLNLPTTKKLVKPLFFKPL
ncbi:hypothetical protein S7335_1379 [Synechococcus sp. PCC 7335]|nr:hypothetical protein S7335_1379 [Synechococcus sp. PCC 7335]